MFEVTQKASDKIKSFLERSKGPQTIRLLLQGGCSGYYIGMAQEEPKEKDVVFNDRGISFAVDSDLLEKAKPIGIDFVESAIGSGFKITSSLPKGSGCSACSGW